MLYHAQKNAYGITLKKTKEEMRIISHSKNTKEEKEEEEEEREKDSSVIW